MKPLPLPVRIAAGLVATAVDQARDLPRLVVEFPVTAVSQALQATMRVQQRVTELAIKGDRALGTLRPVEEKPSWATFDDEELPRRNGSSTVTELRPPNGRIPVAQPPARPAPHAPRPAAPTTPAPGAPAGKAAAPKPAAPKPAGPKRAAPKAAAPKAAAPEVVAAQPADPQPAAIKAAARETARPKAGRKPAAASTSTPVAAPAADVETAAAPDELLWTSESGTDGAAPTTTATAAGSNAAEPAPKPGPATIPAAEPVPAAAPVLGSEPTALPGYANLTIPQLRGRLRFLSIGDLRTLLEWENAHGGRPSFVTMLSNRITTVQAG